MNFLLQERGAPLVVSMPHIGTHIPQDLSDGYVPRALATEDADWHLARLYDGLEALGATVLQAQVARYVIDLNRPPDDTPMYPGASNTELCPTRFFNGDALYQPGREPDKAEQQRRRAAYWQPYHDALQAQLDRLKARHGFVLLWDAHSIRSQIPWLFEGRLPDLNIGTANGGSAHPSITEAVAAAASRDAQATHTVNGRFKGGYITRRYGRPREHVQAVQLEMCQSTYMQEVPPYGYDESLAARIQPTLRDMVGSALDACKKLHG